MTVVLGVMGWPVTHSRSPAMHNAAIAAAGLDAVYGRFPVAEDDLPAALAGLLALGVTGVNVTLPHKEAVVAHLDALDPAAQALGAVNTIKCEGRRLLGRNTDAPGLTRSLEEAGVPLDGARVVVVGAGGAARAAVVGLAQAGAAAVHVAARRPAQAEEVVAAVAPALAAGPLETLTAGSLGALRLDDCTLLVQATSATLAGRPDAEEFAASLPIDALPQEAVVMDLVYEPRMTTVLRAADARGLKTVDGLGMLLHQGALAFQWWLGVAPDLTVMRQALGM